MDEDVKKEVILSKIDYAIKCVREMELSVTIEDYVAHHMIELLKEIEKDVKEY